MSARELNVKRWAIRYARIALGAAFLSGIADRFGLWGKTGYGDFAHFMQYTAQVNSFMPAFTIPFLAWAATAAERGPGWNSSGSQGRRPPFRSLAHPRPPSASVWEGRRLPPRFPRWVHKTGVFMRPAIALRDPTGPGEQRPLHPRAPSAKLPT